MDQWNRIYDGEINFYSYSYLILNKGTQNIHWTTDTPSINGADETGQVYIHIRNWYLKL